MQHIRCPSTLKLIVGLEIKGFYWTHTMIKAEQYFIDCCWKIEFDAKVAKWMGQDLSVHMSLSVGKIDM